MRKTFILLTALLLAAAFFPIYAQRITGTVADAKGQAVEAATVTLFRSADSSKVRTTSTDKAGHFAFDRIPAGNYLLSASSVGYSTVWSPPIDHSNPGATRTVPPLILASPVVTNLKEMTFVAKKPFIEQKPDRTIINVDASPTNAGSSAMDVLEKSPGVTLDKDDNISLKGKQNVMVMIDGKPTYLSPAQLASYLRSLPASAIDQIELMTNPSAKYDAAGNSGIINIRTKKNKTKGFNGSTNLTYSQGVYAKPSGSVNLNYRDGKANFFLNGGYSPWEGFHDLDITRKYLDADGKTINSIFSQQTQIYSANPTFNLKFGIDYYLTSKTTLGFVVSGFRDKEEDHTSSNILLLDPQYNLDSIVNSPSTNQTTWKNGAINLNFQHSYDPAGRELTADLDYVRYGSLSDQYFDNLTYSPAMIKLGESILTGHLPGTINIYTAKTDYTRPLSDGYKLETGVKLSYVNTDNAADYFDVVNEVAYVDTTKTNRFLYRENINAAYVNMTKQYKKLNVQLGLRLENTNYSGHQLGNGVSVVSHDSSFNRSYVNLFPTAYFTYTLNDKNQLTLNYGRRIDRPAYQDLNPFLFFLDQFTYQAGNPYLQPQYTQNVEASHSYHHFLTTTLNYSYTRNYFTETFDQSGQVMIDRTGNIGSRQQAGISLSAQHSLTGWWTAILYSYLYYTRFSGLLYGEQLDISATTLLLNLNNQFSFHDGWGGEISGFYRTKGVAGQIVLYPFGQESAAVTKKIFHDKASLKLAIKDIFYTNRPHGYLNFQQIESTIRNARDTRLVALTFSWNFGKLLKGVNPRGHSGAGDEESRVKSGGNGN